MFRTVLVCGLALLLVAACGESPTYETRQARVDAASPPPPPAPPPAFAPQRLAGGTTAVSDQGPKLAYTHDLAVEMADDMIEPRYERARTACLEDRTLKCNLLGASLTVGNASTGVRPSARLSVRLPHDTIQKFEQDLLVPLPGEAASQPSLRRSSTSAEDLTYQLEDVARRLAQATDYRERLTALSKRGDAKVDDLIKVEDKLSEVQTDIETMTAQQTRLNARVDTELLTIALDPYASVAAVASPLGQAWHDAGQALGESAASAFTFVIVALPWLPLVALTVFLLARLLRMVGRRRRTASVPAATATET